jgi:hypothetical protein
LASYLAEDLRIAGLSIHKAIGCKKRENFLLLRAVSPSLQQQDIKNNQSAILSNLSKRLGDKKQDVFNIQERIEKWLSVHQKISKSRFKGSHKRRIRTLLEFCLPLRKK